MNDQQAEKLITQVGNVARELAETRKAIQEATKAIDKIAFIYGKGQLDKK